MTYSVTVLTWGLLRYNDAYVAAGELKNMFDCIKWPLDYFMKAHTSKYEFYAQVRGHSVTLSTEQIVKIAILTVNVLIITTNLLQDQGYNNSKCRYLCL